MYKQYMDELRAKRTANFEARHVGCHHSINALHFVILNGMWVSIPNIGPFVIDDHSIHSYFLGR